MRLVRLAAGDLEAAFAPDAGMVGCSLRHRGDELLGQRGGLEAWAASGKTMGIPLLHPWANRLGAWSYEVSGRSAELPQGSPMVRAEEHGLPVHGLLHGFARWTVEREDAGRVEASLDFARDPRRLAAFPFAHRLRVVAALAADCLTVRTELTATGDVAVPVAFGWHPYLVLPGVPRPEWEIQTPVRARLLVDDRAIPTGERADEPVEPGPLGAREFDHGYAEAEGAWLRLSGGGRAVEVALGEGYTHAQLFAPGREDVLAFEPMTAPADALRSHDGLRLAGPGETFAAEFAIRVSA